jgi:hypothetical protein
MEALESRPRRLSLRALNTAAATHGMTLCMPAREPARRFPIPVMFLKSLARASLSLLSQP